MRKYIATIVFFLIGFALVVPSVTRADVSGHDDATFDADVSLYLPGNGYYLTVSSGAQVKELEVGNTQLTITLLAGSYITITSPDKKILTNSLVDTVCGSTSSSITITTTTTAGFSSPYTVTVTPSGDCVPGTSGGGGGGGGGATAEEGVTEEEEEVVTHETTTGQATVTASGGGTATATTDEGGEAKVEFPANSVSGDTTVTITPTATTASTVSSFVAAVTSGSQVVGGFVYNFSATSGGETVTTFEDNVTITITYTDDQIEGLDEDTLTISYWDETNEEWVELETTIDTTTNTLTVVINHFTYFAVIGQEEEEVVAPTKPISQMTVSELKAKIAELMAQLQVLIVELAKLKGGTAIVGVPSTFSFTNNLQLAMASNDVKYLQIVLNSSSDTQVAAAGVGSLGNETTYFGALTKAAVIKFQNKYSSTVLTPVGLTSGTGYVGPSTRAKLNALLGK
jgi:hypothetical protein